MQQFPHRISIQKKSTIKNDFSEGIETWGDLLSSIYADVRNLSGKESTDSDQTQNFITISVRIRKRSGVNDDMRVLHGERILKILAILPDPTGVYMDLKCEAWTDAK